MTILFTNDLHGHMHPWLGWEEPLSGKRLGGLDRIASVVKSVREEVGAENVLLLDSGDAWADTLLAAETNGHAVVELMNQVGYDAMTVGNHEPDFGPDELRARIDQAQFPVLAANLTTEAGDLLGRPFLIREIQGARVGLFGLAYPNTPLTTSRKNTRGLHFGDPVDAARRMVSQLRDKGVQIILALTHLGLGAEIALARQVPGIDLIVGGHSHNRTTTPSRAGRTTIMQAGAHGSDVGRLDLQIAAGGLSGVTGRLVPVDHAHVPSDPAVADRLRELWQPYRSEGEEGIAHAAQPIVRAQTIAGPEPRNRDQESPADSLFADHMREVTQSEVALLPGVGYGVAIPAGPITVAGLRNLLPHNSKVVTMRLRGEQILQILEQAIENTHAEDPSRKVGGMIQISGLEFSYNPSQNEGSRVRECRVAGRALDPDRSYQVATNSMLAQGGHNYRTFADGENQAEHGSQFELIRRRMKQLGRVQTPPAGRIRKS